jgi:triosephosphate isomerase
MDRPRYRTTLNQVCKDEGRNEEDGCLFAVPIPIVVGGGVKLADIPQLAKTGVDGFFVVSAVTEADDPRLEAVRLVESWRSNARRERISPGRQYKS